MALMKPTWQKKIRTSCCIKCVYCVVLFTVMEDAARKLRATVKTRGCWAGPKLLIGIILTSCNYSTEIRSCCSGFNKQAITQPTIIITRAIKNGGYSLVKCSHMWRLHILLRTLADKRAEMDNEPSKQGEWGGRKRQAFPILMQCKLLLYSAVTLSYFYSNLFLMFNLFCLFKLFQRPLNVNVDWDTTCNR